MTLLERLQTHRGGLLRLKTELFWYGGRGWDGTRGRVFLLMDSSAAVDVSVEAVDAAATRLADAATLLLIDGCPHWVWVSSDDLELLQPGCNPSGGVVYWHQVGGEHESRRSCQGPREGCLGACR